MLSKVWRPLVIKPDGTKNVAQSYVALPEMQRVFMLILITEKVVMSLDFNQIEPNLVHNNLVNNINVNQMNSN